MSKTIRETPEITQTCRLPSRRPININFFDALPTTLWVIENEHFFDFATTNMQIVAAGRNCSRK